MQPSWMSKEQSDCVDNNLWLSLFIHDRAIYLRYNTTNLEEWMNLIDWYLSLSLLNKWLQMLPIFDERKDFDCGSLLWRNLSGYEHFTGMNKNRCPSNQISSWRVGSDNEMLGLQFCVSVCVCGWGIPCRKMEYNGSHHDTNESKRIIAVSGELLSHLPPKYGHGDSQFKWWEALKLALNCWEKYVIIIASFARKLLFWKENWPILKWEKSIRRIEPKFAKFNRKV